MLTCEAKGLVELAENGVPTPKVVVVAKQSNSAILLLEYIEVTDNPKLDTWEASGHALAALHQRRQSYFGWPSEGFIAGISQENNASPNWVSFYRDQRLVPIFQYCFDKEYFDRSDLRVFETFCKRLSEFFPEEAPSLIHGDLWKGNLLFDTADSFWLIDPASYYGHREMDVAMASLFGGFSPTFFNAYQEAFPMLGNWQTRIKAGQLYYLLVHVRLFGSSYIRASKEVLYVCGQ